MSRETLAMLLTTLLFSTFFGFYGRDDRWLFVPSLRFATASVLCDGEPDQRLPVSNKRLNLDCNPTDGDEPYAVGFMPYLDARGLRRRLPHRENSAARPGRHPPVGVGGPTSLLVPPSTDGLEGAIR